MSSGEDLRVPNNIKKLPNGSSYISDDSLCRILTEPVRKVMNVFKNSGFEIRVVGGAVRDAILGKTPKDVDLATDADPDEIECVCAVHKIYCVKTGVAHGTLTIVLDKTNFEITTLRSDVSNDGRHAVVKFIKDWRLDAERRDLTVNAMSMSSTGELFDYFNGVEDLMNQKIRFVNDPAKRIREDYLRILRFFRCYGKIASQPATIDHFGSDVIDIIAQESSNLSKIAVERIWNELSQIVTGDFAPSILRIMWKLNILEHSRVPYITETSMLRFEQFWKNGKLRLYSDSIPQVSAAALFSAFFKDHSNPEQSCRNLRMSNKDRGICEFICCYHSAKKLPEMSENILERYKVILAKLHCKTEPHILLPKIVQLMLCEGVSNEGIRSLLNRNIATVPITSKQVRPQSKRLGIIRCISELKPEWTANDFMPNCEQ